MTPWFVYVLQCADDTLYTGVTTNVARRVEEHNTSPKGAKYTRVRRPVSLVYLEEADSRAAACVREAAFKKLSRDKKLAAIHSSTGCLPEAGVQ